MAVLGAGLQMGFRPSKDGNEAMSKYTGSETGSDYIRQPIENEILADARMKSANADEIFGFASDEIKSTHPPSRRISPNEVGFHRRRRFHPPARVDLVEKSTDKVDAFFWRRRWDSNPRAVARKLISSQPRYDHFDTAAYQLLHCIINYTAVQRQFYRSRESAAENLPLFSFSP